MGILVVDVGTSGVRASRVEPDGKLGIVRQRRLPPSRPSVGLVELDAAELASAVLELSESVLAEGGAVEAVGIAAQRATTVLWERQSGRPVGPAIGWQDLRTTGQCLTLRAEGLRLAPNQSATKLAYLLDRYDPQREQDLCFGTVDSFVAWTLSGGACHVSDPTNAGVTGLLHEDASSWDERVLETLRVPPSVLPRLVDSSGVLGEARAIPGSPPIGGLVGDQQGSLIGQACLAPGAAKATFGTGGMLDCCTGLARPDFALRGAGGTFPVVAWQAGGVRHWGLEAIMLSAGACLEWCTRLGLLETPAQSEEVAGAARDAGGAFFVPALGGIGTPLWDFGARGTFVGLDATTGRAELVRAVLEGIAHRGADLLEAVEADAATRVETLRVDGGMSANATFLQCLADALGRPVEPAPVLEATTLGAAYLAGVAVGTWSSLEEAAAARPPRPAVAPHRRLDRARWLEAREHALRSVPSLSALQF